MEQKTEILNACPVHPGDLAVIEADAARGWQAASEATEEVRDLKAQLAEHRLLLQTQTIRAENAQASANEWRATAQGLEFALNRCNEQAAEAQKAMVECSEVTKAELADLQARWQRCEGQRFAAVEQCTALEALLTTKESQIRSSERDVTRLLRAFGRGMRIMGNRVDRLEGSLTQSELACEAAENWRDTLTKTGRDALELLTFPSPRSLSSQLANVERVLLRRFGENFAVRPGDWLSTRVANLEGTLRETADGTPLGLCKRADDSQEERCQSCGYAREAWEGFVRGSDDVWRCLPCHEKLANRERPETLDDLPRRLSDAPELPPALDGRTSLVGVDVGVEFEPSPVGASRWLPNGDHACGDKFREGNEKACCELKAGHDGNHRGRSTGGDNWGWPRRQLEASMPWSEPSSVCSSNPEPSPVEPCGERYPELGMLSECKCTLPKGHSGFHSHFNESGHWVQSWEPSPVEASKSGIDAEPEPSPVVELPPNMKPGMQSGEAFDAPEEPSPTTNELLSRVVISNSEPSPAVGRCTSTVSDCGELIRCRKPAGHKEHHRGIDSVKVDVGWTDDCAQLVQPPVQLFSSNDRADSPKVERSPERQLDIEQQVNRLAMDQPYAEGWRAGYEAGLVIGKGNAEQMATETNNMVSALLDHEVSKERERRASQSNFTGDPLAAGSEDRPGHCTSKQSEALPNHSRIRRGYLGRKSLQFGFRKHSESGSAEGRTCDQRLPIGLKAAVTQRDSESACQNMAKRLDSQTPEQATSPWVDNVLDTVSRLLNLNRTQDLALRVLVKGPKGER